MKLSEQMKAREKQADISDGADSLFITMDRRVWLDYVDKVAQLEEENAELKDMLAIYKVLRDAHKSHRRSLKRENEQLQDALYHSGYDWTDCIDCGGPPHNEHCRFWKLRHLFPLWFEDAHADTLEGK